MRQTLPCADMVAVLAGNPVHLGEASEGPKPAGGGVLGHPPFAWCPFLSLLLIDLFFLLFVRGCSQCGSVAFSDALVLLPSWLSGWLAG